MVVQAELLVLAGRPVVRLARLVRMASTVTEVRQAMAATAALGPMVAQVLMASRELMA